MTDQNAQSSTPTVRYGDIGLVEDATGAPHPYRSAFPGFDGAGRYGDGPYGVWGMGGPAGPRPPRFGAERYVLVVLGGFALLCLATLWAVGGVAGLSVGVVGLVAAVAWAARWIAGAGVMDSGFRRRSRLVGTREPTLRYWDAALADAAKMPEGYALHLYPLLLRLYEVRLAERHGVSLRMQPEKAASIVGPQLWPWIDPFLPRTPTAIRNARRAGYQNIPDPRPLPPALLEALVARLETL